MGASSHRKRLSRRQRSIVGLLALVASAIFLLPASQAAAVTQENACINNLVATQASKIPVTTTATALPNPVAAPGEAVTLGTIHQELAIPPTVFLAGYAAEVLHTGVNEIETELLMRIIGTNTTEGEQLTAIAKTKATTTITDPDGIPGNASPGESATAGTVSFNYEPTTWHAAAPGPIKFREATATPQTSLLGGIQITALVGPGGAIKAKFGCNPGEVEESAPPATIVLKEGSTFAETTVNKPTFPVELTTNTEGSGTVACEVNGAAAPCTGTYTSFDAVKVKATPAAEFNVGEFKTTGSANGHCNPVTGTCEFEIAENSSVTVKFVPASTKASVEGNVHGEVPQTTSIASGCASVDLGKFIPGAAGKGQFPPTEEGKSYEGGCAVVVTSTGEETSLTAADLTGIDTGFLTQKPGHNYSLALPLFVGAKELVAPPGLGGVATPGGALVAPVTLMNWAVPVSKDTVGIGFRQPIGEHDPLHTGVYAKTITLTLAQTKP